MKARALKSFAPAGHPPVVEGDVVEVPDGADWVTCGLCEAIAEPKKARKPKAKK